MDKRKHSHTTEIEKLLKLLGTEPSLQANPFLFTRIEEALQKQNQTLSSRPIWQSIALSACLLLGIYGGWWLGFAQSASTPEDTPTYFLENSFNDLAMENFEYQILQDTEL